MVCRIHNLGKHRLALDLRGGDVLYVEPNQISPPLREELLTDNVHLRLWLEQGLVRRIESHAGELREYEAESAKQERQPAGAKKTRSGAPPAPAQPEGEESTADTEDETPQDEAHKPRGKKPRGRARDTE